MQKSKQIGILKAMGIKNRDASMVFVFQGLLLGILGAVTGVILGLALFLIFSLFVTDATGEPIVSPIINWGFVSISRCVAILAALIASAIPARKSAHLDPIEVIRDD